MVPWYWYEWDMVWVFHTMVPWYWYGAHIPPPEWVPLRYPKMGDWSGFSPFFQFWETWTPGKGIYITISKGSNQGLTYLGLTWWDSAGRFPAKQTWVSKLPCFRVFFGFSQVFFQFSGLRNHWKPNCLITDASCVFMEFTMHTSRLNSVTCSHESTNRAGIFYIEIQSSVS